MNTIPTGLVRHLRSLASRQAHGDWSDQQLLEMFLRERSESSFAALVRRHGPMVLSVCRRVLHHEQDAEDAFQAAFLVLAKKAASIRKHESVSSWLHGVAYHVAEKQKLAAARRAARERNRQRPPADDLMDEITWRELRAVLDEELARLPEHYRGPLVLCYLEGRTQDEAARQLGWSKGTFRRRLEQGRGALGRRLTRRGLTLSAALSAPLLADATAQATVPPMLVETAVRAGVALALGRPTTGLVSAQTAALAGGGTKMKTTIALLVALGMAAGGVLMHPALGVKPEAAKSAAPPATQAKAATPHRNLPLADKSEAIEIKGRVLGPDGKPLADARLFLLSEATRKKAGASARATTDKDGRFRFTARPADYDSRGEGVLAATAEGFGLDWIEVKAKGKHEEITLRLVKDDVPIEGRVLDLEGQPIAGITVQVRSVRKQADGGDLASWVGRNVKAGGVLNAELDKLKHLLPAGLDVPVTATTGPDGRFRLTGFGRERVLRLSIRGSAIAHMDLFAVTRMGPVRGWVARDFGLYGARFDCLAAPCKPIVGTVRDKRTGKPLAGMTVAASAGYWCETKTDNQGRYRIVGVAKSKEYDVGAGGMPYINCPKNNIVDTPGLEPLVVNFELDRGIALKVRLIDKATGKPVRGHVDYRALPDNPHRKDFTDLNKGGISPYNPGDTAVDGSCVVVGIPGPGMLGARADDVNRFVRAEGGNNQCHAELRINPSENDPKSTTYEIALEPARVLAGSVVGPDGKPLAGAYAAGRWPVVYGSDLFSHEKLETASFQVGGMKTGQPRTLVFLHPEKKLGKVLKLRGDESKPLLVRLEPLDAALTGRILDAKGRPWPGLQVMVRTLLGGDVGRDKTYPPEFSWGYTAWQKLGVRETTTDRDGRFRLAGLVPGLKYVLFAYDERAPQGTPFAYHADDLIFVIESGKTKDLGDLKSKQTPDERTGK